jgi:hypothetical protein
MRQRKNFDEVYVFSLSGVDRPKENVLPSRSTKNERKPAISQVFSVSLRKKLYNKYIERVVKQGNGE